MVSGLTEEAPLGRNVLFKCEPTLKSIRPQPSASPAKSAIRANPAGASPACGREAQTLSPFALLMALSGLRTRKTLRIFTTEMALDLRGEMEERKQSALELDKTQRPLLHLALTLLPLHSMLGPVWS